MRARAQQRIVTASLLPRPAALASPSRQGIGRTLRLSALFAIGCGSSVAGTTATQSDGTVGAVAFTVNATATHAISPFIYGGNFIDVPTIWGGATPPAELTFNRMGGNRTTAYNWETNYSNAGSDLNFQNDDYLSASSTPGDAVKTHASAAFARSQAFMATIPMIGYVSANKCGCNVGTTDADRATRLATHFRVSQPFKGSALATSPNTGDATVAQDEFVHWFERTFPGRSGSAATPVFYSLDNEPDAWHATHKEIQSNIDDREGSPRLQTYAGFSDMSIEYARAVKSQAPNALVFGPAVATYTGVVTLGRYPAADPMYGSQNFVAVYLDRMRVGEGQYGQRLLDVLDLHWYPASGTRAGEITNDYAAQDDAMIQARLQAPRSLWDPTYDEKSWVSGVTNGPVRMIPRMRDLIAAHYPGTKLAFTEYYFGRGGDISGGIAQADALGIFGREGVFAASLWPQAGIYAAPWKGDGTKAYAYVFGAFRMFRNYDGAGGRFGDTGLQASTSDVALSSVYASRDAAGRIVIVAINKGATPTVASIAITGASNVATAKVYALTGTSPNPVRQPDVAVDGGTSLSYRMPALSVSTLVLQ